MEDFKFLDNLEPIENNYSLIRKNQNNFKIKYVINSHSIFSIFFEKIY